MPDFKAKMHQIRFRLGLRPDPAGGANSTPPDPLTGLRVLLLRREVGREGVRWGREGRGGEGSRVKGRGRSSPPMLETR